MEISIGEILGVIKKKLVWILAVGLVCAIAMFGYTSLFMTPQYTATAKLYVYNGTSSRNYMSSADLTAARTLVDTYIVIIKSESVMENVASRLQESYPGITPQHVLAMFSADDINSTEAFSVSITSPNPRLSMDVVNTIVEVVPDEFKRIVKVGSVEVIDEAELPTVPKWPLKRNMLAGAAVGMILTAAIFVLISVWDRTVYGKEALESNFAIPIIGSIPYMKVDMPEGQKNFEHRMVEHDIQMILSEKTPFSVEEAYRMVRTNIMYLPSDKRCKKYVITSAFSGEGKTISSINLSLTFAKNGKKVILVDADMRKPRVKKNMGLKADSGLSEYLANLTDEPYIVHTQYENLDVITSGKSSTAASELLEAKRMQQLLELLEEKYDYVIIDTPPMNLVTDASVISKHINGYIFSVRCNYSDLDGIKDAIEALKKVNANIVGFLVNGVDPKSTGYGKYRYMKYGYKYRYSYYRYKYGYGYGYKYGYKYGDDEQKSKGGKKHEKKNTEPKS